eukprot:Skav225979  [mRNA]  locus=scaffold4916:117480:117932:+ [translate_table: standard]
MSSGGTGPHWVSLTTLQLAGMFGKFSSPTKKQSEPEAEVSTVIPSQSMFWTQKRSKQSSVPKMTCVPRHAPSTLPPPVSVPEALESHSIEIEALIEGVKSSVAKLQTSFPKQSMECFGSGTPKGSKTTCALEQVWPESAGSVLTLEVSLQ